MNFQREIRRFRLWQFIDCLLTRNNRVLESEIIKYSSDNNIGSKKTVINMLEQFIENKLIEETDLPLKGKGRPKKAYHRPQRGKDEAILINLANLPCLLRKYIEEQSISQNSGKSEVIIQLLTWTFLLYHNSLLSEKPVSKDHLPPHLESKIINRESLRSL